MVYYYERNGQRNGPHEEQEILAMAAQGKIRANDMMWCEGMANWARYDEVFNAAGALRVPCVTSCPQETVTGFPKAVCSDGSGGPIQKNVDVDVMGNRFPSLVGFASLLEVLAWLEVVAVPLGVLFVVQGVVPPNIVLIVVLGFLLGALVNFLMLRVVGELCLAIVRVEWNTYVTAFHSKTITGKNASE